MTRLTQLTAFVVLVCACLPTWSQEKKIPDINESKEFSNVFHSPSADTTPNVFRSVYQLEVVVKNGKESPNVQYSNGTVISRDGLIVTVLDGPSAKPDESLKVESAAILLLDGSGAPASLVSYDPAYGVAVFRVNGLDLPALTLSRVPLAANRRCTWHAVFEDGHRTFLYTRPLRVYKATHQIADTNDLCQIIDPASSSLNADRSGSALVALDGTLLGIMGKQDHWNVTPKDTAPRKKLAWAVPAHVLARLVQKAEGEE